MKIHTVHQPYRKKPFVARWYENGRMRNRFFSSDEARAAFICEFGKTPGKQDISLPPIEPHKIIRWQEAAKLAPEADPVEVFRFWIAARKKEAQQINRNLKDASADYLTAMERMERHPSYIGHVKKALEDLRDEIGDPAVRDIPIGTLRDHLYGLPYSPLTIKHRRTYLLGAYRWWTKQGWVDTNPVRNIECPQIVDKEPGILPIEETRRLFAANRKEDPGICGILALGAFAGMRSSAIARLAWEEIDFAQRGILTPAEKTKKKRRQWIEDLPDNLWKWLEQTPKEIFDLDERQIRHRRQMAFKRAGLLIEADNIAQENRKRDRKGLPLVSERPKCPPKNALRHSFVTYHVALHRNPGKTALIVSHKDQDCLYRHYLGIATKAAAAEYFKIKPSK